MPPSACGHTGSFRETCLGSSGLQLLEGRPISGKARTPLKIELAAIQNFGKNRTVRSLVFPALPDTRPAFQRRVSCFWV
jgi:hypothetical protein